MSSLAKLTEEELQTVLKDYPDWRLDGEFLVRDLVFENFMQAMAFVNRVAAIAEQEEHHPDITIRYNGVRLALTSHDAGGLTARDASLAARLDGSL